MPDPRQLLASDLDGTLIGDRPALERFIEALSTRRKTLWLAYVTGRTTPSALELLAQAGLPRPDFLITSLGGHILREAGQSPDVAWHRRLQPGWSTERVRATTAFFDDLVDQPAISQDPFKCSYYLAPPRAPEVLARLKRTFRRHRISARCVYSSDRDLDIVPDRSGKAEAVRHLVRHLGLEAHDVLTCGDSGNDLDMLTAGYLAAVPGNAKSELNGVPGLYRSRERFADGVQEALRHYGWW